tara:strand:- start:557 stop:1174 length:618 start_codon:yes stop_codon:yes gene_type:complete
MVSILKTDKIQASHGSTIEVPSNNNFKVSGTCVQIAVKNIATKQIINNAANATGVDTIIVSDAFTPKFADSKIFIAIHPAIGSGNPNGGFGIKRTTGGVDTFVQSNPLGSYSGGANDIPNSYLSFDEDPMSTGVSGGATVNTTYSIGTVTDMYALDTHGTAPASIVYTMTFHSVASNEILRLNQPATNASFGFHQSVIILQEWCS